MLSPMHKHQLSIHEEDWLQLQPQRTEARWCVELLLSVNEKSMAHMHFPASSWLCHPIQKQHEGDLTAKPDKEDWLQLRVQKTQATMYRTTTKCQ